MVYMEELTALIKLIKNSFYLSMDGTIFTWYHAYFLDASFDFYVINP
jgi:hypothetical protein